MNNPATESKHTPTTKLLFAQDVIGPIGGYVGAGFNARVLGDTLPETCRPGEHGYADRYQGWVAADKRIQRGELFFVERFHHLECKGGYAFPYGGKWVCNTCGNQGVDRPWWTVKVYQDGNAWCCVGLGFEDLQASNNYAFGNTRKEAMENYARAALHQSTGGADHG